MQLDKEDCGKRKQKSSGSGLSGLHIVHDRKALTSGNTQNIFMVEVDAALNSRNTMAL